MSNNQPHFKSLIFAILKKSKGQSMIETIYTLPLFLIGVGIIIYILYFSIIYFNLNYQINELLFCKLNIKHEHQCLNIFYNKIKKIPLLKITHLNMRSNPGILAVKLKYEIPAFLIFKIQKKHQFQISKEISTEEWQ